MIGEAVDTVVSWFSPQQAVRRKLARDVLERSGGYDAAKRKRTRANKLPSNRSADMELMSDADVNRAFARDLVRNNAYAVGAKQAICRNVVGTGITPSAKVEFKTGNPREKFNKAADDLWMRWQERADITGHLSFLEMQSLVLDEVMEAGECLVRFVEDRNDRSRVLPFALELIEADRIATDRDTFRRREPSGNEIRRGIEINRAGRPVAYWLYDRNPNDLNSLHWEAKRYPAEDFLHLFRKDRIGQTRGMTWFAPLIEWLFYLEQYQDSELKASMIASCFSVAIKSVGGPADGQLALESGAETTDTDGNMFESIQPGLVARLFPDEDVSVINPGRSHSEAAVWVNLMLRSIAVGAGISYERLTRDYSETTFSSNRASDLEDRRTFRKYQNMLICHLCRPVWLKFLASAVEQQFPEMPSTDEFIVRHESWTRHEWQAPGWEWVDPQNQATAVETALNTQMATLESELAKIGIADWRRHMKQRAMEKAYQMELDSEFGLTNEQQSGNSDVGSGEKSPDRQTAEAE